MRDAGLGMAVDLVGKPHSRLAGGHANSREVWTGSHLDTIPRDGDLRSAATHSSMLSTERTRRLVEPDMSGPQVSHPDRASFCSVARS